MEATPPFDYAHDHFGYRDRLSQPVIEGTGEELTPGSGAPLKPGEFILGYPDEDGPPANLPQPEVLSRNGSYMAYRRLQEHVGKFRDFLRENGNTPEEQELLAAKLMGRWRSGAPLVLAPDKDNPALGADPQRNNDFNYKQMDPHGYAVPLGSHIRRMPPGEMNPFIMLASGVGQLYSPDVGDGPFPEHYEPVESPVKNPFSKIQSSPCAQVWQSTEFDKYGKPDVFPIVATTYRVSEHWQTGAMDRNRNASDAAPGTG